MSNPLLLGKTVLNTLPMVQSGKFRKCTNPILIQVEKDRSVLQLKVVFPSLKCRNDRCSSFFGRVRNHLAG